MSAEGSTKAILAALLANAGIAVAKFVGYAITGSSSMLAEAVHSVADTSNQGLLLLGQRQSRKEADPLHQFGYGRSRYFYSFVVALVLLEDSGALIGLVFALIGVGLTVLTGNPVWDGIGTVGIGVLLGVIAIVLMVEMQSLLIGEGATREEDRAIRAALEQTENVDRLIHLRTQYLGPEEMLVGAKIALAPTTDLATVAATIDAAEVAIRAAVPAAQVIYLEPDLDRALTR
jgi:divalent metal cation (Fe/Co/Zn/Cd) transporter